MVGRSWYFATNVEYSVETKISHVGTHDLEYINSTLYRCRFWNLACTHCQTDLVLLNFIY